MGRVVRGGLIQVKADINLDGPIDDIKQQMLDKHLRGICARADLDDEMRGRGAGHSCVGAVRVRSSSRKPRLRPRSRAGDVGPGVRAAHRAVRQRAQPRHR